MHGGGGERVMSILCNELVSKGYEVYLAFDISVPSVYYLDKKINILSLYPDEFNRMPFLFRTLNLCLNIRRIAKVYSPDIIISFMGITLLVIPAIGGLSIPVIASEHTTYDQHFKRLKTKLRMFYMNRFASKVTVLTQHDYNFLGNRIPQKVVMPNPLSLPIYNGSNNRKKTVLAVGRLDDWYIKGFDNLIDVWAKIVRVYPDWILEIAGAGNRDSMAFLRQKVSSNKIEHSVRFLGFQSDIAKVMQHSSVFILSSRNEGFGMVLLEAMSQGCACASFNCKAGPNEILNHNIDGLLVEDQNLQALENTMLRLLGDDDLRNRLSKAALKGVEQFSRNVIISKWEMLFNKLLNTSNLC